MHRKLLALNPDNHRYHEGLRAALQLEPNKKGQWSEEQLQRLEELYDQLAKQYSRSNAVQRIPLNFKVVVEATSSSCHESCSSTDVWC